MKKDNYFPVSIQIEKFSSKGFGVGLAKKTPTSMPTKTSVPGAIPGDVIIAEIGPKRKGSYVGKLLEVSTASKDRREPVCLHASSCGGCSWQFLQYEKQLTYKQSLIQDLFSPLFKGEFPSIIPCDLEWRYRNKMEYTFSQNKAGDKFLGLMIAGSKGRVETLKECHLCPEHFIQILEAVKAWWEESSLLAFHGIREEGSLRTLTVREGKRTDQTMVILTVSGNPEYALTKDQLQSFVSAVLRAHGGKTVSIFLRVQQAIKGQPTQFFEMHLSGPDHIQEELQITSKGFVRNYLFKISPTAFFQPNTTQAEKLYSKALEIAGDRPRKLVLDLYAGTATLGMVFAPFAEKVIAVELNPYAVFDAEVNKEINQIDNLQVLKGDVGAVLAELNIKEPDLIILDPPRTGLLLQALELVVSTNPQEILYISCAPKEQARDCLLFEQAGYEIVSLQPFDQFPHTVHIENIVLLRRKL